MLINLHRNACILFLLINNLLCIELAIIFCLEKNVTSVTLFSAYLYFYTDFRPTLQWSPTKSHLHMPTLASRFFKPSMQTPIFRSNISSYLFLALHLKMTSETSKRDVLQENLVVDKLISRVKELYDKLSLTKFLSIFLCFFPLNFFRAGASLFLRLSNQKTGKPKIEVWIMKGERVVGGRQGSIGGVAMHGAIRRVSR